MGTVSRGRRLLLVVFAAYLSAVGWLWVRYPLGDFGPALLKVMLWGVAPAILAALAGLGAAWARRGLAVLMGAHGGLLLLFAQEVSSRLSQGAAGIGVTDIATYAVVSLVCVLAAAVVLVQKDIREMTRER